MVFRTSTLTAVIIASGTCVNLYLQVTLSRTTSFYDKSLPLDASRIYEDLTNLGGGCHEQTGMSKDWNQIGQSIYGEESFSRAGKSVSISSDGCVVAVWENAHNGKVRMYAWNGELWVQFGSDLLGESGDSISLSSDGRTIAIDGTGIDARGHTSGYVRVYSFNGLDWNQVGADIDGNAFDLSGHLISLSSDGNVVAVGASKHNRHGGCVRVYYWNGASWIQRGQDIEEASPYDHWGHSVAISSDGEMVTIGNPWSDPTADRFGYVGTHIVGMDRTGFKWEM